ncbi:MAG: Trk system potassium transporter TrkA [Opitutales bacterium]
MKIIIVGAGEVGYHLSEILSGRDYDVTVIESGDATAQRVDEELNVKVMPGNGSSASVLKQARVEDCDYFLAMTSDDKTNLVSCSLAKALSQKVTTVARIHDQTYADNSIVNYQLHFGIDYLLNPEGLCAVELAKIIRNPGRVAVENFARGQIEVQVVAVSAKSKLVGKSLQELRIDPRLRIGYIQRGDSFELATADARIQAEDQVTLFGPPETLFEARAQFDPGSRPESVRVVIFGGTETAIALIRLLANPRFKIRLIEKEMTTCRQFAERFPNVTVIQGDGTSLRLLEEEQIGSADYFVACTKDDENNIMTSLQASKLGARHVQLMINRGDYQTVLNQLKSTLGVETVVSPRLATANEVVRSLSGETYVELASLAGGQARILEIRVSHNSTAIGRKIRDVKLPRGAVIVALLHKFQAKVPGADDTILAGDRLVTISPEDQTHELLKRLA